jgi:hypothetical protein
MSHQELTALDAAALDAAALEAAALEPAELETLRRELQEPIDGPPARLDLVWVMSTGRRLRRRRRLLGAGAVGGLAVSALAAAVLVAGAPGTDASGGPPSGRVDRPAAPGGTIPFPSAGRLVDGTDRHTVGQVIETGLRASDGEIVLYFVALDDARLPNVKIGLMAGVRLPGGEVVGRVLSNETEARDRSPGFHAVSATSPDDARFPTFGYHVGPAKTGRAADIVGVVGHRKVVAEQRRWAVDPTVTVFWFSPDDVPPNRGPDFIYAPGAWHEGAGVG